MKIRENLGNYPKLRERDLIEEYPWHTVVPRSMLERSSYSPHWGVDGEDGEEVEWAGEDPEDPAAFHRRLFQSSIE